MTFPLNTIKGLSVVKRKNSQHICNPLVASSVFQDNVLIHLDAQWATYIESLIIWSPSIEPSTFLVYSQP